MNRNKYSREWKRFKKVSWFFAFIIIVAGGIFISDKCYAEGIDKTAPYVKKVTAGATTINNRDLMSFKVNIQEEETGLEYICISYTQKNGNVARAMEFSYTFEKPKYSGTISFSTDTVEYIRGTSQIFKVYVRDVNGNERTYDNGLFDGTDGHVYSDSNGVYLPEINNGSGKCYVGGSDTLKVNGESTTVRITKVSLDQKSVKKGGTITLQLTAVNASRIGYAFVRLGREDGYCVYEDEGTQTCKVLSSTSVKITWKLPKAIKADTYYIDSVVVVDKNEDTLWYGTPYGTYHTGESGNHLMVEGIGARCQVSGSGLLKVLSDGDDEAPRIKSISLLTPEVNKPGVIKFRITVEDNVNVAYFKVLLKEENTIFQGSTWAVVPWYEKNYSGTAKTRSLIVSFPVSNSTRNTSLVMDWIEIKDSSGNFRTYSGIYTEGKEENGKYVEWNRGYHDEKGYYITPSNPSDTGTGKVYYAAKPIVIKEEFDIAVQKSLNNSSLLNSIKNMKEGKSAKIHIVSPYIAKKELFRAIKGKDKTLIFYKDNYQWIFNGKDIKNPKDVRLDMEFRVTSGSEYGISSKMMQIDFYKNGVLPGKANVRIKADYTFYEYGLEHSIYLYYYNSNKNQLELSEDSNVTAVLDDTDAWLNFDVYHNSRFMATKGKFGKTRTKAMKKGKTYKSKKYKCTFKVTGYKEMAYHRPSSKKIQVLDIPKKIKVKGLTYKVTSISSSALKNCKKLKKVKSIGDVKAIGAKAFEGCRSLTKITLPAGVARIGKRAFYKCGKLKTVTVRTSRLTDKTVGASAFKGINKKARFTVPKEMKNTYKKLFLRRGAPKNIKVK